MRTILFSALAVATFGLLTLGTANAKPHWECMGGSVACSPSPHQARQARSYTKRSHHRHARADRGHRRHASHAPRKPRQVSRVERSRPETPVKKVAAVMQETRQPSYSVTSSGGKTHSGMASYYGTESGSRTASGARFNPSAMTAAHRSLPFGTKVRVTNKRNGRSVIVTINDRGPFIRGRIIDLSTGAADVIGMRSSGVVPVSVEVLSRS
jgi:rare lipoprotein A